MKKRVVVTITKILDIDINDKNLTDEELDDFEKSMWKLEDYDSREEALFCFVASQVAQFDEHHIDCVGRAIDSRHSENQVTAPEVVFIEISEEIEASIILDW
ncbi:hypothetical protein [Methylovulum psychrotolerans]|uniref:Uncharacterized protein n=1 Tax=Methylovulum psychrotolerans TaxID=1704499 RepID=A0A2S5CGF0_9GAMM|nr:hypothetical protein [Methylovulum psychrotolerans]POZ49876.1 hypothetical protein AADEFJLK_04322 [Methylovulum psychrotolerans]